MEEPSIFGENNPSKRRPKAKMTCRRHMNIDGTHPTGVDRTAVDIGRDLPPGMARTQDERDSSGNGNIPGVSLVVCPLEISAVWQACWFACGGIYCTVFLRTGGDGCCRKLTQSSVSAPSVSFPILSPLLLSRADGSPACQPGTRTEISSPQCFIQCKSCSPLPS